jgi:hypothetical protein
MKKLIQMSLVAAMLCATPVWAQDKAPITVNAPEASKLSDWIEAKTEHFTIYGNVPDKEMRKFATKIERFDASMRLLLNVKKNT